MVTETVVLSPVAISTLLMTALLGIGLFFFIRSSGKDRVEHRRYKTTQPLETLGSGLKNYLLRRGYQLAAADPSGIATFEGQAQPSGFLAVLLTVLAGVGLGCLAMVLQTLFTQWGRLAWLLLTAAPLAGDYYRFRNQRLETIRLKIEQLKIEPPDPTDGLQSLVLISGHRDELDELEQQFGLEWSD